MIGINLLREGLDIPEVSLVAVTDADKEGFLRSERSLIQTIGRAARNARGKVILYADRMTDSMKKAMSETNRRRQLQDEFNRAHGITPRSVEKKVSQGLYSLYGFDPIDISAKGKRSRAPDVNLVRSRIEKYQGDPKALPKEIENLRKKMQKASKSLVFEEAAKLRDEIKRLEVMELGLLGGGDVESSFVKALETED